MAKRARNRKNGSRGQRRSSPPPPPDFWAMNGRSIVGAVIVVAILIAVAYVVINYGDDEPDGPEPPANMGPAPIFGITDIDGAPVDLEGYRGKVVVLDLFATWCGPCQEQMGELNKLRAAYPRSQVVILSVDVDDAETTQQVRDFRDQYNADWTFCMDTDDLSNKYEAGSIPTMAIIDQDGNLQWRHVGVATLGLLKTQIDPLLQGA